MEELKLEPKVQHAVMIKRNATGEFTVSVKSDDFELIREYFKYSVKTFGKDNVKLIKCVEYYDDISDVVIDVK